MDKIQGRRVGDAPKREVCECEPKTDAQALLAAIVSSSDDAIISKTLDGVITSWNRAAELLYGYTADEAIGRPIELIVPEERRGELWSILDRITRGERVMHHETVWVTRDGREVAVSITVSPIADRSGHIIGASTIARDISRRWRAEDALQESERYLESIFEGIQEGISILDKDMNIVKANHAMKKWYSHALPLEGKKCYAAYQGRTGPCDDCPSLRAMREKTMQTSVVPFVNQSGRTGWIELYSSPLLDNRGDVVGVIEHVRDITERKRAEEDLRFTQFALDRFGDSAIWLSSEGRIVYVNETARKSVGYSKDELLSMYIWDIAPDYHQERFFKLWDEIKRKDGAYMFETNHIARDGRVFPVEVTISYTRYGDREYMITFDRDITERKQYEETLARNLTRLAKSQEIAHLGSWSLNIDTGKYEVSDEIYRIFGFELEAVEPLQELLWTLIHPDDLESFREYFESVQRDGYLGGIDYRIVWRDGSVHYVHTQTDSVVRGEDGRVKMASGVTQDITERKQAEKELAEAKARAELYLDLMGHDINNLNQSAQGFLELALQTLDMDGRIGLDGRVLIEKPYQAVQSSSRLISNVRKIQRLSEEGIKTRPVDLHDLFEELKTLDFHMGDREATVNVHEVSHWLVEGSDLLRDVFFNLVSNAVKHSRPDRPVTVDVAAERVEQGGHTYYRCTVEDDGPGVADDLKPKLFHRFQRGKTQAHGRGLGLYLVRTLVEGYSGKVWVEDRVQGDHTKGARFVVMLPAA